MELKTQEDVMKYCSKEAKVRTVKVPVYKVIVDGKEYFSLEKLRLVQEVCRDRGIPIDEHHHLDTFQVY